MMLNILSPHNEVLLVILNTLHKIPTSDVHFAKRSVLEFEVFESTKICIKIYGRNEILEHLFLEKKENNCDSKESKIKFTKIWVQQMGVGRVMLSLFCLIALNFFGEDYLVFLKNCSDNF